MSKSLKEYRKACQGKCYKFESVHEIQFLRIVKIELNSDNDFIEYDELIVFDKDISVWEIAQPIQMWKYIMDPVNYGYAKISKSEFCKVKTIARNYINNQSDKTLSIK